MIDAKNITVKIDDKTLVNNVSMRLEPGKFSVILGKNGAGKSTFLKALTGDITPFEGMVLVNGKNLDSVSPVKLARKRAVMMQELHLSFSFTALEVVLMGRSPHSSGFESAGDQKIAMECLKRAGVDHLADRAFPTLSGGEKQRVQFARMLAQLWDRVQQQLPCCLLLDEPLSSLDLAHQHNMMHLVKSLSRSGVAVMMILHDLNLAAQYADEVHVMKEGRTFALGSPHEVFKPEIIEMAFDCPVHIMQHPHHRCPLVIASNQIDERMRKVI
ncbi:heme ABC transporter ATP-binding protein [Rhodohalobacter mucosus]|uniref:Heme ABC transporter ATP-binding protein n=1 Tax=Rhodohalobacter mucosus TaxID=2079485 RepID=A0A316TY46_9BACT|nr:heme ABC transporter ATP-binding protein [Rhodohalobacter mucosus]PWN07674.1 heme ABC transporter ATP-binding protein [Rhodohalobacter mucosus]